MASSPCPSHTIGFKNNTRAIFNLRDFQRRNIDTCFLSFCKISECVNTKQAPDFEVRPNPTCSVNFAECSVDYMSHVPATDATAEVAVAGESLTFDSDKVMMHAT